MASETETETNDAPQAEADAPEAAEPKADAPEATADAPPAEAETPKAEEPKAEEPKAEAPKAKAEEPKKDAPKAKDEPKLSAAKVALSKTKKKRETAAKTQQRDDDQEPAKSAQDLLTENMPAILVVVLLLAVVLVWSSYERGEAKTRSGAAWTALSQLKKEQTTGDAGFADLAKEHAGTTAEPYIRLAWASRLYQSGEKDKVEQARDILKGVLDRNADIELIKSVLPGQIKKITEELADPNVPWKAPGTSTPDAGGPSVGKDGTITLPGTPAGETPESPEAPADESPEAPADDAAAPADPADDAVEHDHDGDGKADHD